MRLQWLHRIVTAFTHLTRHRWTARDDQTLRDWQPPVREPAWTASGRRPQTEYPRWPL
jgi:hypothetical protein